MALRSDRHPCVTLALIAYMPRVFEAVQDKCITKANCKKDSKSFYVSYLAQRRKHRFFIGVTKKITFIFVSF